MNFNTQGTGSDLRPVRETRATRVTRDIFFNFQTFRLLSVSIFSRNS